jgi:hypothetical protein
MTERSISQDRYGTDSELELLKSIWHDIITRVEDRKRSVEEEIRNYPAPIPRCDAQFNHLMDQRTKLSQQLSRLRGPAEDRLVLSDYVALISAFLRDLNDVS